MGLMHRESFPVNSVYCAQPRKFSPSKVLPYTVLACKNVSKLTALLEKFHMIIVQKISYDFCMRNLFNNENKTNNSMYNE